VNSAVTTYVQNSFYPEISKWEKVFHQARKNENVQICQNAPRPLIEIPEKHDNTKNTLFESIGVESKRKLIALIVNSTGSAVQKYFL
jgi:hypothetical protein